MYMSFVIINWAASQTSEYKMSTTTTTALADGWYTKWKYQKEKARLSYQLFLSWLNVDSWRILNQQNKASL